MLNRQALWTSIRKSYSGYSIQKNIYEEIFIEGDSADQLLGLLQLLTRCYFTSHTKKKERKTE